MYKTLIFLVLYLNDKASKNKKNYSNLSEDRQYKNIKMKEPS